MTDSIGRGRTISRYVLAFLYGVAGIFHLSTPATFLLIIPNWVPYPRDVIIATGVCELLGSTGLMIPRLRKAAGMALALYAVCVFPANIKHAFVGLPAGEPQLGWWYHAPRLALQPVIVWWALFAGEVTVWPFRQDGPWPLTHCPGNDRPANCSSIHAPEDRRYRRRNRPR